MIRLLLVNNEPLLQDALAVLVAPCVDICLVDCCNDYSELILRLENEKPDVVLMNSAGPVDWSLIAFCRRTAPEARIVLWVGDIPPELAQKAVECGVRGLLRRNLNAEMILRCIRKVAAGELWYEKSLAFSIFSGRTIKLSKRQGELVVLVSKGLRNKEIANILSISEGTVKVYISRLLEKVGAKDRFELAIFGLRNLQYCETESGEVTLRSLFLSDLPSTSEQRRGPGTTPPMFAFAARRG